MFFVLFCFAFVVVVVVYFFKYISVLFLVNSTVESACDCPTKCETVTFNQQLSSASFPSRHVLPMLVKQANATAAANASTEFYDKIETELR